MHTSAKSHGDPRRIDLSRIAQDLQIKKVLVENVVQLLDEENTIPFIARYRKERTGGLDEEMLRTIQERLRQLRKLADRKQTILKSLHLNKLLTPELEEAILAADNPKRLEDLYLPFKKKDKATRADKARERGLAGLAEAIWYAEPVAANLAELLPSLVNPEKALHSPDDVLAGAHDILAERIAESADVRAIVRRVLWDTGRICTMRSDKLQEGQGLEYKGYFQFTEPLRHIPAHRVLAINRGEKENALQVKIEWDATTGLRAALDRLPLPPEGAVPPPPVAEEPAPTSAEPAAETMPATATEAAAAPPEDVPSALPPPAGAAPSAVTAPDSATAPEVVPPTAGTDPEAAAEAAPSAPPAVGEAAPNPEGATATPEGPAPAPEPPLSEAAPAGPPLAGGDVARPRSGRGRHGRASAPPRRPLHAHPHVELLAKVTEDALARLLVPSLEREVRRELTNRAEGHAVSVFARNLRSKLLAPPLRGKRILAVDPAFRTGCKLAVLDEIGNPLEDAVVYPNAPQNKKAHANAKLEELIRKHQVSVIAIGNGTACRETEETISELIARLAARGMPANGTTGQQEPDAPSSAAEIRTEAPGMEGVVSNPSGSSAASSTEPGAAAPAAESILTPTPDIPETVAPSLPSAEPPLGAAGAEVQAAPTLEAPPAGRDTSSGATEPSETPPAEAKPPLPVTEPPLPSLDHLPPPPADLAYIIVNEAGASVYSASPTGREEFPNLDATLRGTISIGRRLQDPLSELVKIDPQHIGVGLYQHDVHLKQLRESLDAVVESCVNTVGVDVNTASVPLLRHVSGFNQLVARDLVAYRQQNGPFQSRDQLKQVPNIGERRFIQAAGFLKVVNGLDPLDRTWVHPESYHLARQVLADLGYAPDVLAQKERLPELQERLQAVSTEEIAHRLNAGVPTARDILDALARPGRDPREDLPPQVFKKGVLKLEDLQAEMELQGTVLNVVDFGAFVDIGLKESGLVHISQMANRFVKNPHEVVAVGDIVTVWVMKVDPERHHVSLSMVKPGTERKAMEERPPPLQREGVAASEGRPPREARRRENRGDSPPRGDRPPPRGDRQPAAARGDRQPAGRGGRQPPGERGARGPVPQTARRTLPPRGSRRQDGPGGGKRPLIVKPAPADAAPAQQAAAGARKPQRKSAAKPNLSQAALAGREALNTFGELAAFWEAHTKPPESTEEAPAPAPAPAVQEEPPQL